MSLMRRLPLLFAVLIAPLVLASQSRAALNFYYDPADGTVAIDTSQTRRGETFSYSLTLRLAADTYAFRFENFIDLFGAGLSEATAHRVASNTLSNPISGYYTIGEILPPGISSEVWLDLFKHYGATFKHPGHHSYADVVGGGLPPAADFFYGLPDREFDNKWDIVDPDTLAWASHVTLVYQPHNGELLVDTTGPNGGHITSVLLKSDAQFLPEGFAPFIEGPLISASENSVAVFADAIEPGRHSLGQVLPSGLSLEEFEASITEAKFISRAGFDRPTYDFEGDGGDMALAYQIGVPEPTTLALSFIVAGIAAASGRAGRRPGPAGV